jgi:hypothetical protein
VTAAFLLVLASGFLHADRDLLAKRSGDKRTFLWAAQTVSALLYPPWSWHDLARTEPAWSGWLFLLLSVLLHGVYLHLLAATYEAGDLSQVYPIMRGTSPLLVPLIGVLLLGRIADRTGMGRRRRDRRRDRPAERSRAAARHARGHRRAGRRRRTAEARSRRRLERRSRPSPGNRRFRSSAHLRRRL